MLTLFSVPKPFVGAFARIQRNAIRSWTELAPDVEILLFGDVAGASDASDDGSVLHLRDVATNHFGTPRLDDVFQKAQSMARHELLCFVNADILLLSDFISAVARVCTACDRFLLVGQRLTLALHDFVVKDEWERELRRRAADNQTLDPPTAIDYFVFSKGLFRDLPPFAVGRPPYDHWLVARAIDQGVPVIDATAKITAVHQKHDYSHLPNGQRGAYHGEEARQNQQLAGDFTAHRDIGFATHMMCPDGAIRPARGAKYRDARRRLWRRRLISWSRPVRHTLGIRHRRSDFDPTGERSEQ